jgi:hypothetical protein
MADTIVTEVEVVLEQSDTIVELEPPASFVIERAPDVVHELVFSQQGPQGIPGPMGPPSDVAHVHQQMIPSDHWVITHNLGELVQHVTVSDSAGTQVYGTVDYVDQNTLTITFAAAFSGTAVIGG